jgi:hypothetical protein
MVLSCGGLPPAVRLLDHLRIRQRLRIQERLHRRLAIAVLAAVRPLTVIAFNPLVHVGLQLLEAAVELLAKRHLIKLLEDSAMKALADPIRLR